MELLIGLIFAAVISGFVGLYISGQKHRSGAEGWWFGFFLGPVGWIIEGLLPVVVEPPRTRHTRSAPADGPAFRMVGDPAPKGRAPINSGNILKLR